MNYQTLSIAATCVDRQIGKVFGAGGFVVVRSDLKGSKVFGVVKCHSCGNEKSVPVATLDLYLKSPAERLLKCAYEGCASRTAAAPASETDVNKMTADEYRAAVVEPEHLLRQARAQAAKGVPIELQRAYSGKIFRAFSLTMPGIDEREHPDFFSGATFFAMPAATRAAWVKWAEDTIAAVAEQPKQAAAEEERLRKLRVKYVRLAETFKQIGKLDELSKYPLQAYINDTPESRQTLDNYADSVLGAGV